VSRARDVAFAVFSALFGAMWLFAAATKIVGPLVAYEFAAQATSPGIGAKAALVATITLETLLGGAMLLRAVGAVRGFAASLSGLAVACAALLQVKAHAKPGEIVQCGCYGDAFESSLDGELVRNAVMAAVLVALILWAAASRKRRPSAARRGACGAESASS